ncbi:hypothetical protein NIA69_21100 [Gemmiger formicilis]|nr:hypothetical protein [Gemmiger formicilis]
MSREELCKSTGFDLMQPFALVTYHPETAPDAGSPLCRCRRCVTLWPPWTTCSGSSPGRTPTRAGRSAPP